MTDSISHLGQIRAHENINSEKLKQTTDQAPSASSNSVKPMADEFVLSANSEQALSTAEFDAEMVARIKAEIAEGNYPVNSEAVAEKFAALESMIYGD
jgi:negative regulator of flagellin synthesis FlgM|tara:strand:+ start:136 stop:429 length:294 start_codon:yes stop_codon:yes gene_type:complete